MYVATFNYIRIFNPFGIIINYKYIYIYIYSIATIRTYVRMYKDYCTYVRFSITIVMCMFACICIVIPLVAVTSVTGGCRYVIARWAAIGIISELCKTIQYNVTLSSAAMDLSMTILTTAQFYKFTGLPDDTLFYVTVFGHTVFGLRSNIKVTSVRTISMYVCTLYDDDYNV